MAVRKTDTAYGFREILGHAMFEWKLQNISKLQLGFFKICSPEFLFADSNWRLEMYSSDRITGKTVGWISLYLHQLIGCENYHLGFSYTISIKMSNGLIFKSLKHKNVDETLRVYGFEEFLHGTDLLKHAKDIAPNDVLTIVCTLRLIDGRLVDNESQTSQTSSPHSIAPAQHHFKDLFLKKQHCDVTLKIMDLEIPAHKFILASRSPVFDVLVEDLGKENVLTINHCDPNIMEVFLIFLYSADVNVVCLNNAVGLYKAAAQFEMDDLEEVCVRRMTDMTVELFCDIAQLAKMYGEHTLFRAAKNFFIENTDDILETRQWITFESEYPSQAIEILKYSVNNTLKCSKCAFKQILD